MNDEKLLAIRRWLGTGSVNIFGKAFSGKDTVGKHLAKVLDAEFLSSGDIIRMARDNADAKISLAAQASDDGVWTPTDEFRDLVLPYLYDEKISGSALILSMVGRWVGEEGPVMDALKKGSHDTRAVILLNVSDGAVWQRWELAHDADSRNVGRADDSDCVKVQRRLDEYDEKTLPVLDIYHDMGIVLEIDGEQSREAVFSEVINKLYEFAISTKQSVTG
jgi:adenylate kinase